MLPRKDGLQVLRSVRETDPDVQIVILTGHGTVTTAVEAMRLGAFDYVMKPIDIPVLLEKIEEAYAKKKAHDEKIRAAKVDEIISHPMAVFSEKSDD